ncbi:MAG: hypothetical protein KAR38_10065 [Calditrichia bacterium]|nr:hypothetical protein [Calditrichia bacterium]
MKKGINSRLKFFIIMGFYSLIIIVWYIMVYGAFQNKIVDIEVQKKELSLNYNQLPEVLKKTKLITSVIDSVNNQLTLLQEKAATINELNRVKDNFKRFCINYKLDFEEFSPLTQLYYQKLENNPGIKFLTMPVNIVLEGKYNNFTNFLIDLDKFSKSLTIGYMSVLPSDKKQNVVKIVLVANLLIKSES